jgi:hypothetical protein
MFRLASVRTAGGMPGGQMRKLFRSYWSMRAAVIGYFQRRIERKLAAAV